MILYIDTANREFIKLALIKKQEVFLLEKNVENKQSENLLKFLDKFLRSKKVKLQNLKRIIVNTGPGSFTSVRIGVVLANTLSFALKIPVVGTSQKEIKTKDDILKLLDLKPSREFVKPFYYKEPNITQKK
ncbi:MAG TPA: tRNA (adenosine(37)-N6)-threonylcarbamoyltransferase complex dimerization subunit type 1 TsaB [bacterium]|nr:tRNA (adenosine(37)-N6)-threonylcarbamoyltransferase complex dimerization subunit type 1 TsaB [bacterium]HOG38171.1 tRNA (adenosine(37)-N6)-threonylcarbamoyltransferase complex dimerization subunit type 1 TsaB [bacterium]